MKSTKIIFLLGEAGSGKDTTGEHFVSKGYTRVSFADALKEEYALQAGIPVEVLHIQGPEKELHRPKLIEYAEAARKKDPLIWLNKAFKKYQNEDGSFKEDLKLVVTDFRRSDEVDWYYQMRSKVNNVELRMFYINRPDTGDKDVLTHYTIGKVYGVNLIMEGFVDAVIHLHIGGSNLTNEQYISLQEEIKSKVDKLFYLFNL